MDKLVIVATSSFDSPSLIYQTPYAAMSIAEYFRDQGIHTLVVLDDLSTHAKFYRELSLLAKRFPGRDSYPGDIFYTHSRLLERAGNFKHPKVKEVSITCLPVIEIVQGDFTSYIATNVMGITDGHIYLDTDIYYQGLRPAVNVPLSVTRVGRQAQDKLSREVNKELTSFLATYNKLLNVSHFGQELTADVKRKLNQGDLLNKFFNQPYQITVPHQIQLIVVSLILQDFIKTKEELDKLKEGFMNAFNDTAKQKMLLDVADTKDYKTFNENVKTHKDELLALSTSIPAHPAAQVTKTAESLPAPSPASVAPPSPPSTSQPSQSPPPESVATQPAAPTQ